MPIADSGWLSVRMHFTDATGISRSEYLLAALCISDILYLDTAVGDRWDAGGGSCAQGGGKCIHYNHAWQARCPYMMMRDTRDARVKLVQSIWKRVIVLHGRMG